MNLEEANEEGGEGGWGVYPHRFDDKAEHETGAGILDPREHHMDRPDAAPDNFARTHDLDG